VIESIDSGEEEIVKDFINNFRAANKNNLVLFFIPDENDTITSGVADELEYDIYMTLGDLYRTIYNKLGINVSTFIDDKKKYNEVNNDNILGEVTDIFGQFSEAAENDIAEAIESIDKQTEAEEKQQENKEEAVANEEQTAENEVATEVIDENKQSVEEDKTNTIEEQPVVEIVTTESLAEQTDIEEREYTEPDNKSVEIEDSDSEEIRKLKMALNDAKYDYNVVFNDMREATERISQLNKIIETVRSEKDAVLSRFNEIAESDVVLEDPISLSEYQSLKEQLSDKDKQINELTSTLNNTKEKLTETEETVKDNVETIEKLQKDLADVNEKIESGEVNKQVIEEYSAKTAEMQVDIDSLSTEIARLNGELTSTTNNLDNATEKLDLEADTRLATVEVLKSAFNKLASVSPEINESKKEVEELRNELQTTKDSLTKAKDEIAENLKSISDLSEKNESFDKRLELANNYSETEIAKLNGTVNALETQLKIANEQLNKSRQEYSDLIQKTGLDSNGAVALIETNKTLETLSNSLKEQLTKSNKDLKIMDRSLKEAQTQVNTYKQQCEQLNTTLQDLYSASNNGANLGNMKIKPIRYNGTAQIINVFGSGGVGTTTTAMSIANKLGQSRVVYVDLDIITPSADAWFCVPPIKSNDIHSSALGIFFEQGVQKFISSYPSLQTTISKTKTGVLDYISGVYYRVEPLKILTADFSGLLNYLGANYQYIIVDLGRLGNSDINDQIIKVFSDITNKNAVVTSANQCDIRNFNLKLQSNSINKKNIAWIINLSENTIIDNNVKQLIGQTKSAILEIDKEMCGKKMLFADSKARQNNDRFIMFMNNILFGK
jgi:hypothetical protein